MAAPRRRSWDSIRSSAATASAACSIGTLTTSGTPEPSSTTTRWAVSVTVVSLEPRRMVIDEHRAAGADSSTWRRLAEPVLLLGHQRPGQQPCQRCVARPMRDAHRGIGQRRCRPGRGLAVSSARRSGVSRRQFRSARSAWRSPTSGASARTPRGDIAPLAAVVEQLPAHRHQGAERRHLRQIFGPPDSGRQIAANEAADDRRQRRLRARRPHDDLLDAIARLGGPNTGCRRRRRTARRAPDRRASCSSDDQPRRMAAR